VSFCIVFLFLLVSFAWCTDTETKKGAWEDYSIISQRNIFSRTRRAKIVVSGEPADRAPAAVRTEQSYLVLRGMVRERDVFISFIEDSRTGEVKRVREGEAIGGGMLSSATMDSISYQLAEADTRVAIGQTLEGKAPEASSSAYYSGGGFSTPPESYGSQQTMQPAQETVVSEDEAKDILQRLKERRKKELGE